MKVTNNTKKLVKFALLFFIFFSSIYVLYLLNSEFKIIESFFETYDCSDCKVKPSSGNCIPIYDISYRNVGTGSLIDLSITNVLTDMVFCEWQPSPICLSNNLPSIDQRSNYTNAQIQNIQSRMNNVTCCATSNNTFYSSYTISYEAINKNAINSGVCKSLDTELDRRFRAGQLRVNDTNFVNLQQLQTNYQYNLTKSLCNDLSLNNYKPGLIFKKIDTSTNIFEAPNILPRDLVDFIMNSNFASRIKLVDNVTGLRLSDPAYSINLSERNNINRHLTLFNYLNEQLVSRQASLARRAIYDDLTTEEKTRYTQARTDLKRIFTNYEIPVSSYLDIKYRLKSKESPNNDTSIASFLLNANQFFNCFGESKYDNSGVFSASNLLDLSNNDYFGVGADASYVASGAILDTAYPSNNDLQMELARLQGIPSSGNAPVSIISTYLNAINSFYEKQIANLTGPRDHVFNQELVFDNNTLETATPTFFTYDNQAPQAYACQQSVTGNSLFKDCGPAAYVEFSKF
jgi:hypothetical protein